MTILMKLNQISVLAASTLVLLACGEASHTVPVAEAAAITADDYVVRDSSVTATLSATGIANPLAQATMSTKLMGSVTAVLVNEGDRVAAGQVLVRIDARDIEAKREQTRAAIASAAALQREATLHANRFRALYADSAAPRAQLDAAEAALERANAALETARAGQSEVAALGDYAVVRAPFSGIVTRRFVDPGAFAAPGSPLIDVQDDSKLRITAAIHPSDAKSLRRGMVLDALIEGVAAQATIEGVFPSGQGAELFNVNALVPNKSASLASGGAAVLNIPQGTRNVVLVPTRAVRREGSLTGVTIVQNGRQSVRWLRLGPIVGNLTEVLAGLRAGDSVRVPRSDLR
jgi:RND family efflux transporter MFP subunit